VDRPKIHFHCENRAEVGMMAPIMRRWKGESVPVGHADLVLIPGDRREAMRKAMSAYELGIPIWHLGAGDACPGDDYHYDGIYRRFISRLATVRLGLGAHAREAVDHVVGPTMTDDLPSFHGQKANHALVMYNPLPWGEDEFPGIEAPKVFAMDPGNDYGRYDVTRRMREQGWEILPAMPRPSFLELLATAREVWGNSSAMCYEAPLWHKDKDIHFFGLRNQGRPIVRWGGGCPSDNVVKLILSHYDVPGEG